ncbi:MAG TPA: Lrp/AsnC family transcriptional regulator [Solirubrobacteraceae bacterium]|jgi:Lrp/AsnC family transcriptional regulator for asnA, asnC and gidA|nr:Lrp/AsnC family transcriptional regulator [Solirubrobacteraceae bacterium]
MTVGDPDERPDERPGSSSHPLRQLDALDRAIISQLQTDGRRPFRAIARSLNVAEGTVRLRATRMQQDGALRILALADPFRLGFAVQASVLIRVEPASHRAVATTLASWPEVMYLSSCAGSADLYMHLICRDHDDLWRLLSERLGGVEGVSGSETLMELHVHKARYVYPGLADTVSDNGSSTGG